MPSSTVPFQTIDWDSLVSDKHPGETGVAQWKTVQFGTLRIREVVYSQNYKADHWCEKGHVIYCIDGEMVTELSDGSEHLLKKGMTYVVSNGASSHRTFSKGGVRLLIVDGDFLS